MNGFIASRMAKLEASRTRVIAMQAENMVRQDCKLSLAYGEESFMNEATLQEEIYQELLNQ